jgi:hypothetical protein
VRWLLPLLLASLLALVVALSPTAGAKHLHDGRPLPRFQAPRVPCAAPQALRLRRFEDGSARLLCGERLLVRVVVPG